MTIKDLQEVARSSPCIAMEDQHRPIHSILMPGGMRIAMLTVVLNVMRLQCDMIKWMAYGKLLPMPADWSPERGHPFEAVNANFLPVADWTEHEREGVDLLVSSALEGLGISAPFKVHEKNFALYAQVALSDAELDLVDLWLKDPANAARWLSLHPDDQQEPSDAPNDMHRPR